MLFKKQNNDNKIIQHKFNHIFEIPLLFYILTAKLDEKIKFIYMKQILSTSKSLLAEVFSLLPVNPEQIFVLISKINIK